MTAIRSFCKTLCIGAGTFLIAGAACAQGTPWFAAANSASKQVFIGDLDPVTGIRGNVGFYLDAGNILDQNFRGFTFAPDAAVVTPGVPEPASWAMLIAGFGLVGGAMRRQVKRRAA